MAGKPKTRAAHARIRDAGGEGWVFREVARGRTLGAIAAELSISRPLLSQWCLMSSRPETYLLARQVADHD